MTRKNRRQFLEDSMLATAAVAATSASTQLIAAEEDTQSDSPAERLGVAVVGGRGRGGSHIGAFSGRKDTEILYICDPDAEIGNRIRAVIVARDPARAGDGLAQEIRAMLKDRIAPYKVPQIIEFTDTLPKSPVGKVLRRELTGQEETE